MEKFLKMRTAALFLAVMCVGFTSCRDDNDEPGGGNDTPGVVNPSNVFTGEMPKSVAGTTINRNSEGLVTEMRTDNGKTVTFEYGSAVTRANNDDCVIMTIKDSEGDLDFNEMSFRFKINKMGFVSEWYNKENERCGKFGYNDEGQLNELIFISDEGGNIELNMIYKDGNLVKTVSNNNGEKWNQFTFYGSTPNKGCVMIFNGRTFGIECDDYSETADFGGYSGVMTYLYYAGLLGKPTKNLPTAYREYDRPSQDNDMGNRYDYQWEFDANGYPTKFVDEYAEKDVISFTW